MSDGFYALFWELFYGSRLQTRLWQWVKEVAIQDATWVAVNRLLGLSFGSAQHRVSKLRIPL
jgi:hypothetical protein